MRRNKRKIDSGMKTDIASALAKIDSADTMRRFLGEIFTETEFEDISLRWRLMKLLNAGVTQREIASELGISLCKITRGAKVLKRNSSVAKSILSCSHPASLA